MADTPSTPPPPILGRYRIVRRLGAGGMAEVFLAKLAGAEGIDKVLVLKRVLPTYARSVKFRAMFLDEAKVATRLNHPNVVQVYSFEQIKDDFLLAMELVDGLDLGRLASAAKRHGARLPHGLAAFIVAEVAKGLDYAHNRKDEEGRPLDIVHRDVSPQNVLISHEGTVKIADFGIAHAKLVSEETGVIKGKFAYMSPEQARGVKVDRRSDVYSLGVLLSELLMGRTMYPGQQGLDLLDLVREGKITLPRAVDPTVPEELERIVKKATDVDLESRYQSARALGTALTQWLHAQDVVWDGAALEELITRVAPRETTSPEGPRKRMSERAGEGGVTAVTVPGAMPGEREHRERRHVVVVAGTMRTPDASREPIGAPGASGPPSGEDSVAGAPDAVARVLSDIAFKHDAVLRWRDDGDEKRRFRVVLGVGRASVQEPLRAVRLALDVVEALQGLAADMLAPVAVSLGVSRGMVTVARAADGRLLRAEPVGGVYEIAERLAASAAPFEVLAAGDVYRAARRDFAFDEAHVREVPLPVAASDESGARTVRAIPVLGLRTARERTTESLSALVGRETEIASLAETYAEAIGARRSAFVAVVGELGVGKTALLDAAFAALTPAPRVLHVECAFGLAEVPFAAAADLVREAFALPRTAASDELRARLEADLDALLPRPEDRVMVVDTLLPLLAPSAKSASGDGDERASAVLRAVRTVLGALAARAPLGLRVDALQWADPESLALVAALLRRGYELPLFVALATRPDPRVDAALSGVPRLELGELDVPSRHALVRMRFGGADVPADVEQAIVERAGGNPFFVLELVEAMIERELVAIEGPLGSRRVVRRPGPITLPTTLEGAIAARLAELDAPDRAALRWLAAAGPGLRVADLSGAAGEDLTAPLARLADRGLVATKDDGTVAIESAVVRHVAYESADPEDRRKMHRRIGAQLAQLAIPVPPARVARHLERGGDRNGAADAYLAAATAARDAHGSREALRLYARALALLPADSPSRFSAHESREQILRGLGRRRERRVELEALRSLADRSGEPSLRAIAYERLARYELEEARTAGVDALLRRALDAAILAGSESAEVEALRLSAHLARELGDLPKALDACDRALLRAGTQREQLAARGNVLVLRGELLRRAGRVEPSTEDCAEAVVIFRRLGRKRDEANALNALAVSLYSLGSWEDSIALLRRSIALDRELGDRFDLGKKLSNIGQLYGELGDVARAEAFLERAVEVQEALDDRADRADALIGLAELLLDAHGDDQLAEATLDRARALAESTGDHYDLAHERLVRAAIASVRGEPSHALALLGEAVTESRTAGTVGYELLALAREAEALAELGRDEDALSAATEARAKLARTGAIERTEQVRLALARAFALAGDPATAEKVRDEALAVVDAHLARIRDDAGRERYLATRTVRALHSPLEAPAP